MAWLPQYTEPHVYVQPFPNLAWSRRAKERHKSNLQRRRDGAGHKSNALYCGDRGSVHVTNQSSSVSGMAGETNHGDPISSAACPSVRREKIKSWAVVEPDIKKTEREIE